MSIRSIRGAKPAVLPLRSLAERRQSEAYAALASSQRLVWRPRFRLRLAMAPLKDVRPRRHLRG